MLRLILPNLRKGKYRLIGNLSVNNYCKPTLSISQSKVIVVRNILEHRNNTNAPVVMKLHASEVGLEVVV